MATISGSSGDDFIQGSNDAGDDIYAGAGNDNVEGRDGNDTIYGGSGNDFLLGYNGSNTSGGDLAVANDDGSEDTLYGGDGDDTLVGGDGDDRLYSGTGDDTVYAGEGDDFVDANSTSSGNDTIYGGGGSDTLEHDVATDLVYGGTGNDRIVNVDATSSGGTTTIFGGSGNDTYVLDASEGGSFGSNHVVNLDAGQVEFSGASRDQLNGIENVEINQSNAGVVGDGNANTISAIGAFANTLEGGDGDDLIYAGAGDDVITGDRGDDTLYGGDGNDSLDGGDGADVLYGETDDDSLFGGSGNDTLSGGSGNDTIDGGVGNDILTGGTGNDTFIISSGGGSDTVTDFAGNDLLDASALSDVGNVLTNQDGTVTADEITVTGGGGANQVLTFPSGETVTVPDGTVDTTTSQSQFASLVGMGVPPCFATGTHILTEHGEVLVEDLRPGDRIVTADHGLQTLRWIGRREVLFDAMNPRQAKDKPLEIKAGALGGGVPSRRLIVSPQHRMVLSGPKVLEKHGIREVLALAKGLASLEDVRVMKGKRAVEYFALLFDRHEVIYAEGAPTESFRPGHIALADFAPEHREEIYAIYPGLRDDPGALGPPARPIISRQEAEMLVRELRRGYKRVRTTGATKAKV